MKLAIQFSVIAIALAICNPANAQIQSGVDYDVYFLAGQSNASGRGDAAELPSIDGGLYATPQSDVQFFYRSTLLNNQGTINTTLPVNVFQSLQAGSGHGFNNPGSHAQEFGPELSLGRSLADSFPQKNIAIIKYSHGGSNLHTDWAAQGDRYTEFLDVVSDALADITTAGASYKLRGLGWIQGESDTATANANAYQNNLEGFVSRVRNDVFGFDAPIVISRLSDNQYNSLSSNIQTVRNAQVAVADGDERIEWIDTDGAAFSTYNINNPIHFDARGNISQGNAIGQAFSTLVTIPEPNSMLILGLGALGMLTRRCRVQVN